MEMCANRISCPSYYVSFCCTAWQESALADLCALHHVLLAFAGAQGQVDSKCPETAINCLTLSVPLAGTIRATASVLAVRSFRDCDKLMPWTVVVSRQLSQIPQQHPPRALLHIKVTATTCPPQRQTAHSQRHSDALKTWLHWGEQPPSQQQTPWTGAPTEALAVHPSTFR